MKKTNSIIVMASLCCCIMACTGGNDSSKNTSSATSDSTKVVDTISVMEKVVSPVVKDPQEELINVYKDVIATMKANGNLSKLDKYIYSETGLYMIYPGPDNFNDYEKYKKFPSANGDEDTWSDNYQIFQPALAKIDTALLSIKFNDAVFPFECDMKKKGTTGFFIQNSIAFLSNVYKNKIKRNGSTLDKEELGRLENAEAQANEKIVLNVFYSGLGNGAEVLYFTQGTDKKWYLLAMDLANCEGNNANEDL